ncbi:MAG: amidohydrolase [Acidimicrobiia bacterium]
MSAASPVIDAQVHAYERDHPGRPWADVLHGPAEVTGEQMVAAMDAVGVDGAVLVSPWTMYRYDASYAEAVHAAHPGRFALVKPLDPMATDTTDVVTAWKATPGAVGVRLMLYRSEDPAAQRAGSARIAAAAGAAGLPLNVLCWGRLGELDELAATHPDTQFVLDHLGLRQPFEPPAPPEPWADLPNVLALARHPNIAIKISGACTLSHRPFPYEDLWEPLGRLFDAFGLERCLWGTDWTRATGLLTYDEGVRAFTETDRLSDGDRAMLMGGSLTRVYGWSPSR